MTIGTIVTMSKSYYIVTYETLIVKSPLIVQPNLFAGGKCEGHRFLAQFSETVDSEMRDYKLSKGPPNDTLYRPVFVLRHPPTAAKKKSKKKERYGMFQRWNVWHGHERKRCLFLEFFLVLVV